MELCVRIVSDHSMSNGLVATSTDCTFMAAINVDSTGRSVRLIHEKVLNLYIIFMLLILNLLKSGYMQLVMMRRIIIQEMLKACFSGQVLLLTKSIITLCNNSFILLSVMSILLF